MYRSQCNKKNQISFELLGVIAQNKRKNNDRHPKKEEGIYRGD
jgi:hypothetical protein